MEHLILHRNICWFGPYGSHQDTKTLFVIETFVGLTLRLPSRYRINTLSVIETFVGLALMAPINVWSTLFFIETSTDGPYDSHQDTKTLKFVIETFVGLALEAPIKIRNTLFVIETFVGLAIKAPTKIPKNPICQRNNCWMAP